MKLDFLVSLTISDFCCHLPRCISFQKHKRQRDGYEEGNYTLFKEMKVSDFIACDNPIEMLATNNKVISELLS